MRELWLGDRVDFEGEYYKTKGASIYDVPEGGIPIYIAAGGPQVAKYAGRAGDGFICTSGKGAELYKDKLIPAVKEGEEAAGKAPDDIDRMIEIKISYDTDPELALENTRFWAPLSLTAEQKTNIHDPLEMEKAADELPIEQVAKRWIVASDPDEAVAKVKDYVDWGLNHLVFHAPGPRPAPLPRAVPEGPGAAAAQAGLIWQAGTRDLNAVRRPSTSRRPRGHRQVDDRARHPAPARRDRRQGGRVPADHPHGRGPRLHPRAAARAHHRGADLRGVRRRRLPAAARRPRLGARRHRRPLPPGGRAVRRRADRRQRLHRRRVAQRAVASTRASRSTSARPIVLAVRAADRTPDDVAHVVELCLAEIAGQHAHTAAVVANRCDPAELDAVAAALQARRPRRATCCPRSRCWSRRRSPS